MWSVGGRSGWTLVEWLLLIEREMLVFALFWFLIGMADELAIDLVWFYLRRKPQNRTPHLEPNAGAGEPAVGRLAVFVAAWREADVIGTTIADMLGTWRDSNYVLYVGCYGNDPATVAAATRAVGHDPRLRLVIHDRPGPTTKADCLNRVYAAMCADEARSGQHFHGIVLHDSEDMVHPLELRLIDRALGEVDFVQLPVRPEIPEGGHAVAGHYCDEFAETHARSLVVRSALGAGVPAAGVSCGFGREMLERIRHLRADEGVVGPFAAECFTEDYELGMLIARLGGRSRFLRCRDAEGHLVGTRSYFPNTLVGAVRQKTRWMHGICLQSWDRLGWNRGWPMCG
jgi:adsorption protein B